jgi:carboxyl-terminal processing protease
MIIIVNERTASAAEVVAGALQKNDRAVLVGQRTRGKGSVQFIYGLSDGSSFRITGAVWLTPDRTPLDGFGLTPDIEMIPDENNRDVELGEAIRQLNQQLVPQ